LAFAHRDTQDGTPKKRSRRRAIRRFQVSVFSWILGCKIIFVSHRRSPRRVFACCNRYAQKKADEMKAISLQSALDTVEKLELKLTDFAKKHQSEIQHDPVFRQR
jgi:hypothetical protein